VRVLVCKLMEMELFGSLPETATAMIPVI